MAHFTKARTTVALLLAALALACAAREQEPVMAAPVDPTAMPAEYHGSHISRDGIRDRLPSES